MPTSTCARRRKPRLLDLGADLDDPTFDPWLLVVVVLGVLGLIALVFGLR